MEPETEAFILAEFSKINFVLEALWANVLLNNGATPDGVDRLRDDLLRQFTTLPATSSNGGPAPANETTASDLAAKRIETFFGHVRARIQSVQAPARRH